MAALSPEQRRHIARHGTVNQRWHLTGEDDLDPEIYDVLAADPDPEVRSALLSNYATPQHVVEQLAAEGGEFAESAKYHPNASLERLESGQLNNHILTALHSFLDRRGAASSERYRLFSLAEEASAWSRDHVTLGAAWRSIRPGDEQTKTQR